MQYEFQIRLDCGAPPISGYHAIDQQTVEFSINPTIAAVSTMMTALSVLLFVAVAALQRRALHRRTRPVADPVPLAPAPTR